jgi:hypothetical protein
MQVQKPTFRPAKATPALQTTENVNKLWQRAMQALHGGLARTPLVLQAQQAYFACIERKMRTKPNRGSSHGRF